MLETVSCLKCLHSWSLTSITCLLNFVYIQLLWLLCCWNILCGVLCLSRLLQQTWIWRHGQWCAATNPISESPGILSKNCAASHWFSCEYSWGIQLFRELLLFRKLNLLTIDISIYLQFYRRREQVLRLRLQGTKEVVAARSQCVWKSTASAIRYISVIYHAF